jgi:hypothetical protein
VRRLLPVLVLGLLAGCATAPAPPASYAGRTADGLAVTVVVDGERATGSVTGAAGTDVRLVGTARPLDLAGDGAVLFGAVHGRVVHGGLTVGGVERRFTAVQVAGATRW